MVAGTVPQIELVSANGIQLGIRSLGDGPVVLLVHGFPGTSYSWRHQFVALADAGFRAVAVDTRGYGSSDRPEAAFYPSFVIEADLIGVLDALGISQAHVVGQDFGSMYAWNLAQRHPDRVLSALGTVPFGGDPMPLPPSEMYARVAETHFLHLHYLGEVGIAEQDLGGPNLAEFLLRLLWALSADGDLFAVFGYPTGTSYLAALPVAPPLPWSWLSMEEFDTFVADFARGGSGRELAGGLASYRAADADWSLAREWSGVAIAQPTLLVMGEHDPVRSFTTPDLEQQRTWLTDLRDVVTVEQAGHFVQQEQPAAFNEVLIDWLSTVAG